MGTTISATADLSGGRATVVSRPDKVRLEAQAGQDHVVALFLPGEARELAAALLQAADEAESSTSEVARLRTELAAIDDALRDAGIDYPLGVRGVRDLAALRNLAREDD